MSEDVKKERLVQFKMTPAEYERMKDFVEVQGIHSSISDFIRESIKEKIEGKNEAQIEDMGKQIDLINTQINALTEMIIALYEKFGDKKINEETKKQLEYLRKQSG